MIQKSRCLGVEEVLELEEYFGQWINAAGRAPVLIPASDSSPGFLALLVIINLEDFSLFLSGLLSGLDVLQDARPLSWLTSCHTVREKRPRPVLAPAQLKRLGAVEFTGCLATLAGLRRQPFWRRSGARDTGPSSRKHPLLSSLLWRRSAEEVEET